MADIVLINPRFEVSFWGMEYALPLLGKQANLPVAALPLLAALTPREHTVTLIDENIGPIDFDRCARADIVGVTGMSVQRFRMTEILTELRSRGCFIVVGGPWVTVQEDYFDGLADAIFIGEAEETWPKFLEDWAHGRHGSRYEQAEKTDMTRVPVPRFDLVEMNHYAFGSLQFSRGCPFQCEFCDIIVTFGRRPRLKTAGQVIAELDAIKKTGQRLVFIVDDNFIGNKKAMKAVLGEVIAWQQRHGYPLSFFTEASIDLADDPELMELMTEADFIAVFVGIESPSEEALRETKKLQNVRAGGTLLEKIHRIQDAGLEVWCGMIMGFDSDDSTIFDRQIEFIQQSRIAFAMTGLLHAIPKTPLYQRMLEEGRLDPSDRPEFVTNIRPLQISPEELRAGYLRVMNELFDPANYFARAEALFLQPNFDVGFARARPDYWRRHRLRYAWTQAKFVLPAIVFFLRLMAGVESRELRHEYRRRLWQFLKVHRRPGLTLLYLFHLAMHHHVSTMARTMATGEKRLVNSF
ncbi:MAG: B12-binding domain-containing radical SAM protein [Isosphaeraceae bacterium]